MSAVLSPTPSVVIPSVSALHLRQSLYDLADLRVTPVNLPPVERLHNQKGFIEYGKFYPLVNFPNDYIQVNGRVRNMVSILNPPDPNKYLIPIKFVDFRVDGLVSVVSAASNTSQFIIPPTTSLKRRAGLSQPPTHAAVSGKRPYPVPRSRPSFPTKAKHPRKNKPSVRPIPTVPCPPLPSLSKHPLPSLSKHRVLSDEKGWKDVVLTTVPQTSPDSFSSNVWHVMVGSSGSLQWTPFDSAISQSIEKAFQEKMDSVGYFYNQYPYKLVFSSMNQVNLATHMERKVKRCLASVDPNATLVIPKPQSMADSSRVMALVQMLASSHPSYWTQDDIQQAIQSQGKLVPCLDIDPEFSLVSQMIQSSHHHYSVVRVSKIINPVQYFRYVHWCDNLHLKFPAMSINEQYAFHGTPESALMPIIKEGFKYRFNGRHMYGRGSYMALKADYCLDPLFASPNADGERHVLVVRVCVGKTIQGRDDMMPSTDDSYQTAVDRAHDPTMYVTFHDDQTYPEFLAVLK